MTRLIIVFLMTAVSIASGQEQPKRGQEFLDFVRAQATALRQKDRVPESLEQWKQQRSALREKLSAAWGGFPAEPCDLKPTKLGELQREGYRVEKIIFQTRPDVWMTANAYVPAAPGKHPAVLCVHGHWRGAKQDPVVQSRCIGLVKHGFFVLVVDAFGAGERGVGKALGEYHGDMTGATLFPIGLPLSGLQVYENTRAVDYLRTRPEVDGDQIGITGASGGGNQTMYAGGWDERFGAVVPVCSVGTYQVYLGAACCMCEVVPGALSFTEEWGVLGLSAPRGLMVVNATRDAPQFSVAEAKKSLASAEAVFRVHGHPDHLRHAIFESPHDYNGAMREAMYGWMSLHLARKGDGSPLPEPEFKTEDPEVLRCYPGESRPADFMTIPKFAAREGERLLAKRSLPPKSETWQTTAVELRQMLRSQVFGGDPPANQMEPKVTVAEDKGSRLIEFSPEPGLTLTAKQEPPTGSRVALLLDLDGSEHAATHPVTAELRRRGWSAVALDLRATGRFAQPSDRIGRAPDHNTAEWAMWIGRPLLGQWVVDVRRALDAIEKIEGKPASDVAVVGLGPAGAVAICAAALDGRIQRVAAVNMLSSFITAVPYEGQRLGILAPGIVRDVGDVADLIALAAPRRVVLAGGVTGGGKKLPSDALRAAYQPAESVWKLLKADRELRFVEEEDRAAIVAALEP
jgi:cephalosporin-C deacetylase-like acetyl esterase